MPGNSFKTKVRRATMQLMSNSKAAGRGFPSSPTRTDARMQLMSNSKAAGRQLLCPYPPSTFH